MIKSTFQHAVKVDAETFDGTTPLQLAILLNSDRKLIELLVKFHADVNKKSRTFSETGNQLNIDDENEGR